MLVMHFEFAGITTIIIIKMWRIAHFYIKCNILKSAPGKQIIFCEVFMLCPNSNLVIFTMLEKFGLVSF